MINRILSLYKRPIIQDIIKTTFWSTIGKAVGFLIPFFIAAWFGVSKETDAFFFAYGVILFLSGIFAPVVESVIVPYISEARAKHQDVGKLVGSILSFSIIGLLILSILLILVIKPFLSLITRFDEENLRLILKLILEISPLIILLTCTSVLAGVLNTYKKFTIPAISPAFRAAINLIIIFTFRQIYGVHSIAFGYLIGELVRLAFLFTAIKILGLFEFQLSLKLNYNLIAFLKTASYQVIGMIVLGLNPVVDKIMASWLGEGSVSVLYYADRLYMIPVTILTTGLMVSLLSHWSGRYYESEQPRLKKDVGKAIKIAGLTALIIMLLLILFHKLIVKLLFGWGSLTQSELSIISFTWLCYLFGFAPYVMGQIYVKGHMVLKNTKTLMYCALYMNIANIILNYILMKPLKVAGIALGTSIIYAIGYIYLTVIFNKKVENVESQ